MLSDPKSHHAFQQSCSWIRRACQKIDVRLCEGRRRFAISLDAVFALGGFNEVKFFTQVADSRDEEIQRAILGVNLTIGRFWKPHLANERSYEPNHRARDVTVLAKPVGERTGGQGSATSVREELLLRRLAELLRPLVEQMGGKRRLRSGRRTHPVRGSRGKRP